MGMRIRMVGLLTHVSQWEALLGSAQRKSLWNPLPEWHLRLSPFPGERTTVRMMADGCTPKEFFKLPWMCLENTTLETQQCQHHLLSRRFSGFFQGQTKEQEGKRGMRIRAGKECSNCTSRYPILWFVQAAFKLCCIRRCHEESPSSLSGNEREGREKKGVGESWLCLECNVRHQHGELFIIPQLWNALISLLHLWHSLPLRAGENTRLFW